MVLDAELFDNLAAYAVMNRPGKHVYGYLLSVDDKDEFQRRLETFDEEILPMRSKTLRSLVDAHHVTE